MAVTAMYGSNKNKGTGLVIDTSNEAAQIESVFNADTDDKYKDDRLAGLEKAYHLSDNAHNIGSPLPADQNANSYKYIGDSNTGNHLNELQDLYFKKYSKGKDRYNYRDYIKLIQYMDHTLFKIIEQHVPARTNLKTGVLIEPHYLERNKFSRNLPTTDEYTTMLPQSHQHFQATIDTAFVSSSVINNYCDIGPTQRKLLQKSATMELNENILGQQSSGSKMHGASTSSEFRINVVGDYVLDEIQIGAQAPINPVVTTGIPFGYKQYLSSVLLGNATTAPLSKIYFRSLDSGSESYY